METDVIKYAKDEMVGIAELGNYLDNVTSHMYSKIAIIRRNKPEAVIIPIEEYELLQSVYDKLEQKEIESILKNMSNEDRGMAKIKTISIDV